MLPERRFAIASLIFGVIGLFYSGLILGCLAIIFSLISIAKDYREDEATHGLMLGIICVCAILCQIIGLNYAAMRSRVEMMSVIFNLASYPYMNIDYDLILIYLFVTLERAAAHTSAITIAGALGGPIPFYWFYAAVMA